MGFKKETPIDIVADDEADYQQKRDAILKEYPGEFVESKKIVGVIIPLTIYSIEPVVTDNEQKP